MSEEKIETANALSIPVTPRAAELHLEVQSPQPTGNEYSEDLALALLNDCGLLSEKVERLAETAIVRKSRKVRRALAAHPHAPRHLALRIIREFYTFDLMQFALTPGVGADLKRSADELLVSRLASITLGERLALARRASGTVATSLLLDKESRVWQTALENSRLTEAALVRILARSTVSAALVEAVSHHVKWSARHEVRMALLRNAKTPVACAIEFARTLPPVQLREILRVSHLSDEIKSCLEKESDTRFTP